MRRMIGALAVGLLAVAVAHGHALYVVPDAADPAKVVVVFSDELAPDAKVKAETWKKFDGLKLTAETAAGKRVEVATTFAKDHLKVEAPAGTRLLFAQVDYGVSTRGGGKPTLLRYYPKAIVGTVPADGHPLGEKVGLDVVPKVEGGKVRFQVQASGKPAAGVKVSVIVPGKTEHAEATTDEAGLTQAFEGSGRYGVTARKPEDKSGEANGVKYELMTHVATLVVDVK